MEIIDGKDLTNMKFIKTEDGLLKEYKPQGRFVPKKGEEYWFIDSYGIINVDYNKYEIDNYLINHKLVFRTKIEAEDYRWFIEQLDKYKTNFSKEDWEDGNIRKYYLFFNFHVNISYNICTRASEYNFTKENINKFIKVVGEDRIKKYIFDIWD